MTFLTLPLFGEAEALPASPMPEKAIRRFMDKVRVDEDRGCWMWVGARDMGTNYGRFKFERFTWNAHRWSYTAFVSDIPEGMFIDHLCINRLCVNPSHLEPVTPGENSHRRVYKPSNRSVCHACGRPVEDGAA